MHPKINSQKGEGKPIPPIPFSLKHKQPGAQSREITGSDLAGDFPCAALLAARRPARRKCIPEHQKKMARCAAQDAEGGSSKRRCLCLSPRVSESQGNH